MYNEQEEILREQIYDVIRYECEIDKKDSLPDILLNYGQYAIRGEYADNLTYQYIPQTLSIAQSYELSFPNKICFRDSRGPITFIINLFK